MWEHRARGVRLGERGSDELKLRLNTLDPPGESSRSFLGGAEDLGQPRAGDRRRAPHRGARPGVGRCQSCRRRGAASSSRAPPGVVSALSGAIRTLLIGSTTGAVERASACRDRYGVDGSAASILAPIERSGREQSRESASRGERRGAPGRRLRTRPLPARRPRPRVPARAARASGGSRPATRRPGPRARGGGRC